MKPLALVIALALACPAYAGDDAPLLVLDKEPMSAQVKRGEPAPMDGLLLSNENAMRQAKRVAAAEAERDALKTAPTVHVAVAIVIGVLAAGVGVGIGIGILKATEPKP